MAANKKESVGKILRKAREERGFSIDDVMEETRIRAIFIEALEADNDDELPTGVYKKLYIKSYCDFLDIDSDKVLNNVESDGDEQEEPSFEVEEGIEKNIFVPSKTVITSSIVLLIAVVLIFVATNQEEPKPQIVFEQSAIGEISVMVTEKSLVTIIDRNNTVVKERQMNEGDVLFIEPEDGLVLKSDNLNALQIFADGNYVASTDNLERIDGGLKLDANKLLANVEILSTENLVQENIDSNKLVSKPDFDKINPQAGAEIVTEAEEELLPWSVHPQQQDKALENSIEMLDIDNIEGI